MIGWKLVLSSVNVFPPMLMMSPSAACNALEVDVYVTECNVQYLFASCTPPNFRLRRRFVIIANFVKREIFCSTSSVMNEPLRYFRATELSVDFLFAELKFRK